jgi:hypothetical protein
MTRGGFGAVPGCAVHAEVNHTRERVIYMSRLLSCPGTCTQGYLVCRVPTISIKDYLNYFLTYKLSISVFNQIIPHKHSYNIICHVILYNNKTLK